MNVKEKAEVEELAAIPESDAERKWEVSMDHSMGYDSFTNYGVGRARERRGFIQALMAADENMDRLIEKTPVPKGIECKTCQMAMHFCNAEMFG
jgi:hypothetical protein